MMRVPIALALASLVLFPVQASAQSTPHAKVVTKAREFDDVRITQDDLRGVEGLLTVGGRQQWKPDQILQLEYKAAPDVFKQAKGLYDEGDYERAAQLFAQVAANAAAVSAHPWIPAYANWYRGQALSRIGRVNEAVDALQKVVTIEPKPRFTPEAYATLIELELSRGAEGAGRARKHAQDLAAVVKSNKLSDRYGLIASLGAARVELRTGDPNRALTDLEGLLGGGSNHPDVANIIRLEIGNAYVRGKDHARAESYFKGIIDSAESNPEPDLLAGAFNGLGDAQMALNKYEDALWTYSRTYGLFEDRADQRERVAHALFHGGKAFQAQAGLETAPEKKDLYKRRGTRLLNKVAKDKAFQGTLGSAEAKKALGFN